MHFRITFDVRLLGKDTGGGISKETEIAWMFFGFFNVINMYKCKI